MGQIVLLAGNLHTRLFPFSIASRSVFRLDREQSSFPVESVCVPCEQNHDYLSSLSRRFFSRLSRPDRASGPSHMQSKGGGEITTGLPLQRRRSKRFPALLR